MLAAILVLCCPALAGAVDHVVVEPSLRYQTLSGYGQGSMDQWTVPWHSDLSMQARARLLDRLYTLDGDGLGLTICRTYLCAGDAPGHAHFSRRPGGSRAPLGYEPQDGIFQWEGHEPSIWHAQGAAKRGAMMVAFFLSPPWWMTVSGCTSGAAGGDSNLRAGMEDRFAEYMCQVLKHYRDAWGVDFDRVCPINEPEALWWKEEGGQDGCHFDASQAAVLIGALGRRLGEHGLKAKVQGPEAAFSSSLPYLDELLADGAAYEALAELTCHQYITDFHDLRKWPSRSRLHGKPLWMSEWGDWTNKGSKLALNYAAKLHEAHRLMQAVAWCMWEPAFLLDQTDGDLEPNAAYYAVAQFSRFARPGMVVVEASDTTLKTTCYLDPGQKRVVLVTVNDTREPHRLRYDLSAFRGLGEVSAWRTGETECLASVAVASRADGFSSELPPQSITTFSVGYESIDEPLLGNGGFETGHLAPWQGEPSGMTGVQSNYPHGGSHDGFIDIAPGLKGSLWQEVKGLEPGRRYALTAACATSGAVATLSAEGPGLEAQDTTQGGGYRGVRVEFTAPPQGAVTIRYSLGPSDQKTPWATIDSVRLSPM